jgi:hypothetical protein
MTHFFSSDVSVILKWNEKKNNSRRYQIFSFYTKKDSRSELSWNHFPCTKLKDHTYPSAMPGCSLQPIAVAVRFIAVAVNMIPDRQACCSHMPMQCPSRSNSAPSLRSCPASLERISKLCLGVFLNCCKTEEPVPSGKKIRTTNGMAQKKKRAPLVCMVQGGRHSVDFKTRKAQFVHT